MWSKSKSFLHFLPMLFLLFAPPSNATFSIVAVDTVNQQVGVAAASCVEAGGIGEICHIEPGKGAIIAQGLFSYATLNKGKSALKENSSAQGIINQMIKNDANKTSRQLGAVTLHESERSAAFSGTDLPKWFGHKTGSNYSIQGNILAGESILDDMQTAFNTTDGLLAEKLMAALQAAKRVGADSRCTETSCLCVCIKVANLEDELSSVHLNIEVDHVEGDPIDVLQSQFDEWQLSQTAISQKLKTTSSMPILIGNYPNPFNPQTTINYDLPVPCKPSLKIYNIQGRLVRSLLGNEHAAGVHNVVWDGRDQNGVPVSSGVYMYKLIVENNFIEGKKMLLIQ